MKPVFSDRRFFLESVAMMVILVIVLAGGDIAGLVG